jgi:hypothetical protein
LQDCHLPPRGVAFPHDTQEPGALLFHPGQLEGRRADVIRSVREDTEHAIPARPRAAVDEPVEELEPDRAVGHGRPHPLPQPGGGIAVRGLEGEAVPIILRKE